MLNYRYFSHYFCLIFGSVVSIFLSLNVCADSDSNLDSNSNSNSNWSESYQFEKKGEYLKAIDVLKPMTKKFDSSEFANMRIGWLHYLQGQYSHSIVSYNKALVKNHRSLDTKIAILSPLAAQFRWKEVAVICDQILKVAPWNYQAHLFLMQSRNNRQQWDKLKSQAKKLTDIYPEKADPWIFLARAYLYEGEDEKAKSAYQQVLFRYPANIEASVYINSQ